MTDMEATKLTSEVEESMLTPSPPSLAGSANSRLSTSLGRGRPVRLGDEDSRPDVVKHLQMATDGGHGAGEV